MLWDWYLDMVIVVSLLEGVKNLNDVLLFWDLFVVVLVVVEIFVVVDVVVGKMDLLFLQFFGDFIIVCQIEV